MNENHEKAGKNKEGNAYYPQRDWFPKNYISTQKQGEQEQKNSESLGLFGLIPEEMLHLHILPEVFKEKSEKNGSKGKNKKNDVSSVVVKNLFELNKVFNGFLNSSKEFNKIIFSEYSKYVKENSPLSRSDIVRYLSVLSYAISMGHEESFIYKYLIELRENKNIIENAVRYGCLRVVEWMLDKDQGQGQGQDKSSLLALAVQNGHPEIVSLLIDKGADVNSTVSSGKPIILSVILELTEQYSTLKKKRGWQDKFIVTKGTVINKDQRENILEGAFAVVQEFAGEYFFHYQNKQEVCVKKIEDPDSIKFLQSNVFNQLEPDGYLGGADVPNVVYDIFNSCVSPYYKIAKILIEKGANLEILDDSSKKGLLELFADHNFRILMNAALQRGANPNVILAKNKYKQTLFMKLAGKNMHILGDFIKYADTLDLSFKDREGESALNYAVESKRVDNVKRLIEKEAECNVIYTVKIKQGSSFFKTFGRSDSLTQEEKALSKLPFNLTAESTSFELSIFRGYYEITEVFLENNPTFKISRAFEKVSANREDILIFAENLFYLALKNNFHNIAKQLIEEYSFDLNEKYDLLRGMRPIVYALKYGRHKIAALLIENEKVELNKGFDNKDEVPLILAFTQAVSNANFKGMSRHKKVAKPEDIKLVEELLKKGVDLDAKNEKGEGLGDIAFEVDNLETVFFAEVVKREEADKKTKGKVVIDVSGFPPTVTPESKSTSGFETKSGSTTLLLPISVLIAIPIALAVVLAVVSLIFMLVPPLVPLASVFMFVGGGLKLTGLSAIVVNAGANFIFGGLVAAAVEGLVVGAVLVLNAALKYFQAPAPASGENPSTNCLYQIFGACFFGNNSNNEGNDHEGHVYASPFSKTLSHISTGPEQSQQHIIN